MLHGQGMMLHDQDVAHDTLHCLLFLGPLAFPARWDAAFITQQPPPVQGTACMSFHAPRTALSAAKPPCPPAACLSTLPVCSLPALPLPALPLPLPLPASACTASAPTRTATAHTAFARTACPPVLVACLLWCPRNSSHSPPRLPFYHLV